MNSSDASKLLSIEDVRQRFDAAGVSVSDWACAQGLSPAIVYALLSGRVRGRRGQAHRAAVALGLKKGSELQLQGGAAAVASTDGKPVMPSATHPPQRKELPMT
jgi:gp16 family phage-associated protein